ncbi:MAG: CpaF family protein [Alphaproteobacteria bacterium]
MSLITDISFGGDTKQDGRVGESDVYQDLKFRTFELVLEYLEMKNLTADDMSRGALKDEIGQALSVALMGEGVALNAAERTRLIEEVEHEITGLGPLEPLLADPAIDDVIVNGARKIFVEKKGKMERAAVRFRDDAHLMNVIQRIVGPIGRRIDESSPYVDARLPDGSRVNVVIPPVALDGPMVSIRKFRAQPITVDELIRSGSIPPDIMDFLARAVASRLNILISGGTGSGKTTFLNILSSFIGEKERLVTIEDAAELRLRQEHVVRLETRPSSTDGPPEVDARDLVKNALRMRPDRIILGEVRGAEAVDMLQAMSTGHDGSMATLHANSPRDALGRIEMLLDFGGLSADTATLRRYIASSVQVIVQVGRLSGGTRRVLSVTEVTGVEAESYSMNELWKFVEDPPLSGQGRFEQISRRPYFENRLTDRVQRFAAGGSNNSSTKPKGDV